MCERRARAWKWGLRTGLLILVMPGAGGGFVSRLCAQQIEEPELYVRLGLSLNAPVYDSGIEIEQHAAFSAIFAAALTRDLDKESATSCKIKVAVDFPDLTIQVTLRSRSPGKSNRDVDSLGLMRCVQAAEPIWARTDVNAEAFESALGRVEQEYRRVAAWDGANKLPQDSVYRLPMIGRAALRTLYQADGVVPTLLDRHLKIRASSIDYSRFVTWLSSQRQSGRMGIYHLAESAVIAGQALPARTIPSVRPTLKWPDSGADLITPNLPMGTRRPTILILCAIERDRMCAAKTSQVLCNRERVERALPFRTNLMSLECGVVKLFGIAAWLVVESDDEDWLKELYRMVAKEDVRGDASGWNLIEQAAWIATK